jgi:hypothetical protein
MVVINPTQRLKKRQLRIGFWQQRNRNAFKLRASLKPACCKRRRISPTFSIYTAGFPRLTELEELDFSPEKSVSANF